MYETDYANAQNPFAGSAIQGVPHDVAKAAQAKAYVEQLYANQAMGQLNAKAPPHPGDMPLLHEAQQGLSLVHSILRSAEEQAAEARRRIFGQWPESVQAGGAGAPQPPPTQGGILLGGIDEVRAMAARLAEHVSVLANRI